MSVKILVVSLARAVERRRFMEFQFRKLGLDYEFVDACDALNISDDELSLINRDRAYKSDLTRGEIACARSHAKACERLANDGRCEYGVILEDDVIIGAKFRSVLDELQQRGRRSEVVLLYAPVYRKVVFSIEHKLGVDNQIIRPDGFENIFGTQAYFISSEKARVFSRAIVPVKTIADDWKRYMNAEVFSSLALVFPFPVLHAEFLSVVKAKAADGKKSIRTRLKNFIYVNQLFPFYQIFLSFRQKAAETRQKSNILIPQLRFSKTYKL